MGSKVSKITNKQLKVLVASATNDEQHTNNDIAQCSNPGGAIHLLVRFGGTPDFSLLCYVPIKIQIGFN